MKRAIRLFLILAILGVVTLPVLAQTPTPNEIDAVAKQLWCPLCNGVRLDNCELKACEQMREVIAEKLVAGESTDQIKTYFVQQYGDVVLGEPPRQGFNLIVWLFPIVAVVAGLGWLAYLVVTWRTRQRAALPVTPTSAAPAAEDDYVKQVEQELKQLD